MTMTILIVLAIVGGVVLLSVLAGLFLAAWIAGCK